MQTYASSKPGAFGKTHGIFVWFTDTLVIAGAAVILARLFSGGNQPALNILSGVFAATFAIQFLMAEPSLEWKENRALLATLLIVEILVTIVSAILVGVITLFLAVPVCFIFSQSLPSGWWSALILLFWVALNGLIWLINRAEVPLGDEYL